MAKILVIDDEIAILELVKRALEKKGHNVDTKNSPDQVHCERLGNYELIILDIMMPDTDGLAFCKKIREIIDCPILFLSARNLEEDIIYGLAVGADDYITKPFSINELCARVDSHLRREKREHHNVMFVSDIRFELMGKELYVGSAKVPLTKSEYEICEYLARNRGQVFTKEQIYEAVFGVYGESDSSTIAVHIKNIRTKLYCYQKEIITTVWGIGYKWA